MKNLLWSDSAISLQALSGNRGSLEAGSTEKEKLEIFSVASVRTFTVRLGVIRLEPTRSKIQLHVGLSRCPMKNTEPSGASGSLS